VDKAIVFGIASRDEESPNDATAAFVRAYPEKLIGFLSIHPLDPHCIEEMERCVSDLGLRGLKLGPNYQNFDPLCEAAFEVYRHAERLGLPIVFHTGTSPVQMADLDYAHPRHFDRVAIAFPDLRMVLAHMAHPWQATTIAVIRKHPHVYADISALFYRPWSFYNCMLLGQEWGVLHKLLFGTDYLVSTPQENLDALRNPNRIVEGTSLPRISEAAMEEIIHRDTLGLLGLAG
jgi:predicted TIM-barrel fold metal-dependent hydrolase